MDFFQIAIVILFGLAISDLIVGVSNDAVNFLNSSIGSRVAPRHVIMVIASLGMLAGVTFSSGMMEVARKGIFHPQFFTMPELMTIFLAVMLTDIILLDLYNTFGLPTSTTVSIVFELLGAAVAVSLLKLWQAGQTLADVFTYINSGKALAIIFGILLSVVVAFLVGAVIQFLSRMLLHLQLRKTAPAVRRPVGRRGPRFNHLLHPHQGLQGRVLHHARDPGLDQGTHRSDPARLIRGLCRPPPAHHEFLPDQYPQADRSRRHICSRHGLCRQRPCELHRCAAGRPQRLHRGRCRRRSDVGDHGSAVAARAVQYPFLLLAGVIMVVTLWVSRKARSVTRTEVRLGRQEEGFERFESTVLSQTIVRLVASVLDNAGRLFPRPLREWATRRFDRSEFRPTPTADGTVPSFDLVRAGVNVMVASALISLATSYKLPLSTTYVTFMVAMGTSLSDQAWGRDSAVYRVSGVLTVIGGWFFTAMMAFTVSSIFATAVFFGGGWAVAGIVVLAAFIIYRTHRLHRRREKVEQSVEVFNLRKIKDSKAAIDITFDHVGLFLGEVGRTLNTSFEGLFEQNRHKLKHAREGQRKIQHWSNVIAANTYKIFRLVAWEDEDTTHRYATTLSALQEVSESLRDIVVRAHLHVANNHSGLLNDQIADLDRVHSDVQEILRRTAKALREHDCPDCDEIAEKNRDLRILVGSLDQQQIHRIRDNRSKTRLSILFYSLMWDCLKIAENTTHLLSVFREPPMLEQAVESAPVVRQA